FFMFTLWRLRPRISSLFPYPTLFRSCDVPRVCAAHQYISIYSVMHPWYRLSVEEVLQKLGASASGLSSDAVAARKERYGPNALRDRKSTRLNSSHVKSSYAVFCLKKK